jgi:hypothetical protein
VPTAKDVEALVKRVTQLEAALAKQSKAPAPAKAPRAKPAPMAEPAPAVAAAPVKRAPRKRAAAA